jgi:nitroreductase
MMQVGIFARSTTAQSLEEIGAMIENSLSENPPFFDLVGQVRAMRRLKPDPIPLDTVRKVLQAGVQASSGMNSQPWKFVAIRSTEKREWFGERYKAAITSRFGAPEIAEDDNTTMARMARALKYQADHMHESPLILLVAGKRDWPFKVPESDRVGLAPPNYGAVYPCVQNILLACRSLGLGAALTTMHQVFEDELHAHFDIPTDYGVVVSIPIGYPMGRFGPVKRIPASELTYFDTWGNMDPGGWL